MRNTRAIRHPTASRSPVVGCALCFPRFILLNNTFNTKETLEAPLVSLFHPVYQPTRHRIELSGRLLFLESDQLLEMCKLKTFERSR